jgi:hypothetical protein
MTIDLIRLEPPIRRHFDYLRMKEAYLWKDNGLHLFA